MDLARPYIGSHVSIFMDNFYSGVPLFEDLKAHGLYACGTVRSNRKGIPPKPPAMDRHQYQVSKKDDLTFCAWRDTKVVLVLSNYHEPMAEGTVRRRQGDIQTEVTVPACYNSYIAARSAGAYKGGYKEWQEDLAQELVTPVTAKSAPQCAAAPVAASAEHDCEKIFDKRKICRECSLSKSEARPGATVYGCRQCNVPLHIQCFGKHYRSTRQ
ncbi:unnamed protein product [Leuciscus chuanchicus]